MTTSLIGTYAACTYTKESLALLQDWMFQCQIPNPVPIEKMHTTLLYSRLPLSPTIQESVIPKQSKILNCKFSIQKIELFTAQAKADCDNLILVALLKAPSLVDMHMQLRNAGGTHDFDEYIPHLTLSYSLPTGFNWKNLSLPKTALIPEKVYFEPLDLERIKDFS